MTGMKRTSETLESKKHHKNNFLFANNLFQNVYIYRKMKRDSKAAGDGCFLQPNLIAGGRCNRIRLHLRAGRFWTAFAPSHPKNITKTILFFANNLFPNVYIYGCTKKPAGENGTGEGKHSHTKNTVKNNFACHKFASRLSFKVEGGWEALLCSRPRKHRKNKFLSGHLPVFNVYIHGRVRNAGRTRLKRRLPEREPGGKDKGRETL